MSVIFPNTQPDLTNDVALFVCPPPQLKDMNNYLTVPAAPPDSPTMCRARLASGKHARLSHTHTHTHVNTQNSILLKASVSLTAIGHMSPDS